MTSARWWGLSVAVLICLASCPTVQAGTAVADSVETVEPVLRGLKKLDWAVIGVYGVGVIMLGVGLARRQTTVSEYFVGGGRMGSFVIGLSLFATLLSAISYLSYPGEMIGKGPVILVEIVVIPFNFLVAGYWLIPALMTRRVTSAYELLEQRLGVGVRLLAACLFIGLRVLWMGLILSITSNALLVMLGLPDESRPWVVLISGAVAVAYTTLGGLRAVVVTDVLQFFLLLGGGLLTILLVSVDMGGFSWWPTSWSGHWDHQHFLPGSIHDRVTILGTITAIAVGGICLAGSDQMMIQRYMATPSAAAARRSYLIKSISAMLVYLVLALVGFALLGYFASQPELIPGDGDLRNQADELFPRYIVGRLPAGIAGMVVAALFAASMSSLDSGINSITAVVQTDLIRRFGRRRVEARQEMRLARALAMAIGFVIVLAGAVMHNVPGNIMEVANKIGSLLPAPLFALFFLALFVPWATPFGAVFSAVYGVTAAVLVAFWDVLTAQPAISFQWITLSSLVVAVAAGLLFSLLPTREYRRLAMVGWSVWASLPVVVVAGWAFAMWLMTGPLTRAGFTSAVAS